MVTELMLEPLFEIIPWKRAAFERIFHRHDIHKTAVICRNVAIAYNDKKTRGMLIMHENSWLCYGCYVDITRNITLGKNVQIAPRAMLFTHDSSRSMEHPKTGEIFIDDDAYVGAGAIVLCGVKIGKKAIVGAGAVVTKDVPDGAVVVGVPARKLGVN